jgi:hypothetical protein
LSQSNKVRATSRDLSPLTGHDPWLHCEPPFSFLFCPTSFLSARYGEMTPTVYSDATTFALAVSSHDEDGRDRPFRKWTEDRLLAPSRLDARRIDELSVTSKEEVWLNKRRHAPIQVKAPEGKEIDVIYFREAHESSDVRHILDGTINTSVSSTTEVDSSLIFLQPPFVPMRWSRAPQRLHGDPLAEYGIGGDITIKGETYARDSQYALYV